MFALECRFEPIRLLTDGTHVLPFVTQDETSVEVHNIAVTKTDFLLAMIEVIAEYGSMSPAIYSAAIDETLGWSLSAANSIPLNIDLVSVPGGISRYSVFVVDGDNGDQLCGSGETVLDAIADLIRWQGFKSALLTDKRQTLKAFIATLRYGREKLSAELLHAELEAIVAPGNGAW